MNRFQTTRRLSKAGELQGLKLGIGLTPACQHMLAQMIRNGVDRMISQNAREEQIFLAESNMRKCLATMRDEANRSGTYPLADEKAFESAILQLCPLWPYC